MGSIASKVGCTGEALGKWVRQAEIDAGLRGGDASDERARTKELESGGTVSFAGRTTFSGA